MPPQDPSCNDNGLECVTDAQIQQEIASVVAKKNWPLGLGSIYLLVTPQGVGSCGDASLGCYETTYCAYHNDFTANGQEILYANLPYGAVQGCDTGPNGATPGQRPNNNSADATLNLISHEQIETITDPVGSSLAWLDTDSTPTTFCPPNNLNYCAGYEVGDLCASDYATQTINGHPYYLQKEWSNIDSGCSAGETGSVAQANGAPLTGSGGPNSTSGLTYYQGRGGSGPVVHANSVYVIYWTPSPRSSITGGDGLYYTGDTVSYGAWSDDSAATFSWNFGDGTAAAGPSVSHAYGAPGTYTVTLTVTNSAGSTTAHKQVVIHGRTPPTASFTASNAAPITGQAVTFDGSASSDPAGGGGVTTWSWSFDDGSAANGPVVAHTFTTAGPHAVTLTVTDAALQSSSVTHTIQVTQAHVATKALKAIVVSGATTLRNLLRNGLIVTISCDGSCTAAARLLLHTTASKTRHSRTKLVDVGHVSGTADAGGKLRLTLKLTSNGKKRLRHQRRPALTVVVDSGMTELTQAIHPR